MENISDKQIAYIKYLAVKARNNGAIVPYFNPEGLTRRAAFSFINALKKAAGLSDQTEEQAELPASSSNLVSVNGDVVCQTQ